MTMLIDDKFGHGFDHHEIKNVFTTSMILMQEDKHKYPQRAQLNRWNQLSLSTPDAAHVYKRGRHIMKVDQQSDHYNTIVVLHRHISINSINFRFKKMVNTESCRDGRSMI